MATTSRADGHPDCDGDYASVMESAPEALTKLSPASGVRGVANGPNQSMVPAPDDTVSARKRPEITAEDENGPKVIAALFEAEPEPDGVAAAPIDADCRV